MSQASALEPGVEWQQMEIADDPAEVSSPRSQHRRMNYYLRRIYQAPAHITAALSAGVFICFLWIFLPRGFLRGFGHGPPPPHHWRWPSLMDDQSTGARPSNVDWPSRANQVKDAFLHAYHGYERYAMPRDELLPLSNGSINNFNGWAVTIVDSLDTMYIMGLHEEFERGLNLVKRLNFTENSYSYAPFFETTIRYLGGLLSAYALSHDLTLLQRADELGMLLLPVFNTTSGLPKFAVNPYSGATQGSMYGWLAEVASCQMEYKYLAKLTGRKEYYDVARNVTDVLYNADTSRYGGLLPTLWNTEDGQPANEHISIGAMADSAYEYLLKQWILTNRTESKSLELYKRTITGVINHSLYLSPERKLLYVTDIEKEVPSHKFEHLSCFVPGLLALGAQILPNEVLKPDERQLHRWAAQGLAISCATMYSDQPTGVGAEEVYFWGKWEIDAAKQSREGANASDIQHLGPSKEDLQGEDDNLRWVSVLAKWQDDRHDRPVTERHEGRQLKGTMTGHGVVPGLRYPPPPAPSGSLMRDYRLFNTEYRLRPETIESLFILWRTTGEEVWREIGWDMFLAIESVCKTPSGYAQIMQVADPSAQRKDAMPSYFLAETLKYLYLLFSDDALLPLDQYVLNTEAHPFPVFSWTEWEKDKFGIS